MSSSSSSSSSGPTRSITLTKAPIEHYVDEANNIEGFRLTVTASDPVLMPAEIFQYLLKPANSTDDNQEEAIVGICCGWELEEFPIGGARLTDEPPFFRKDSFDVVLSSYAECQEAWELVSADVKYLIDTLNAMDDTELVDTVNI